MAKVSLVTGGAGFIGSHLVDELVREGKPVRVLDDFSTGTASNLAHHEGKIEVVKGNIADRNQVRDAVREVDTVYHLGALASVARSVENPFATHEACTTGTLHVLNESRLAGVQRIVFAASSSAYGGASSEKGQVEDQIPSALSPYAAAKLAGEYYMQSFAASFAIETVRLRFFNIFGPRQRADSPYSGVIALFIDALKNGRTPTVHGDGLQSRDFTYVANAVQALRKAAETPGVSGKVFNVGTGNSTTVLDLIHSLNRLLGTNVTPKHAPPRTGDVRYSLADISRTRAELGYEPTVSFEDGLRLTIG